MTCQHCAKPYTSYQRLKAHEYNCGIELEERLRQEHAAEGLGE